MTSFLLKNRQLPFINQAEAAKPVWIIPHGELGKSSLPEFELAWAKNADFDGKAGQFLLVPNQKGELAGALFGTGEGTPDTAFISGQLAKLLPDGEWELKTGSDDMQRLSLGFGLGAYKFDNYLENTQSKPTLMVSKIDDVKRQLCGVYLTRDLINIPTNDMGPDELEDVFCKLAKHYDAEVKVILGENLLKENFPLIHTVGRASENKPRLLDMRWGKSGDPKITLVGKGVCFDTGGLDIKPASAMSLMKKDMGGAANVLGLALMIMDAKLPVDLRILIPAVENSISANAFRPSDILTGRNGLTIQIDNTDAEGRLVLADALTYASEDNPDLIVDMATLTGAARVALGPDLPPFYTDNEELATDIYQASVAENDPLWRMPLYSGYEADIKTRITDLTNAPSGGFAGSITAALFLKRFIGKDIPWVHFDIYGWSPKERPHCQMGGEAQAIRALYRVLKDRYQAV